MVFCIINNNNINEYGCKSKYDYWIACIMCVLIVMDGIVCTKLPFYVVYCTLLYNNVRIYLCMICVYLSVYV